MRIIFILLFIKSIFSNEESSEELKNGPLSSVQTLNKGATPRELKPHKAAKKTIDEVLENKKEDTKDADKTEEIDLRYPLTTDDSVSESVDDINKDKAEDGVKDGRKYNKNIKVSILRNQTNIGMSEYSSSSSKALTEQRKINAANITSGLASLEITPNGTLVINPKESKEIQDIIVNRVNENKSLNVPQSTKSRVDKNIYYSETHTASGKTDLPTFDDEVKQHFIYTPSTTTTATPITKTSITVKPDDIRHSRRTGLLMDAIDLKNKELKDTVTGTYRSFLIVSPGERNIEKKYFSTLRQTLQKIARTDDNREEPYHVPVYNFEPKNAYFNPHNNLGPNGDDTETFLRTNDMKSIENNPDFSFDIDLSDEPQLRSKHEGIHANPGLKKKCGNGEIGECDPPESVDSELERKKNRKKNRKKKLKERGPRKPGQVFPDSDDSDHVYNQYFTTNKTHFEMVKSILSERGFRNPLFSRETSLKDIEGGDGGEEGGGGEEGNEGAADINSPPVKPPEPPKSGETPPGRKGNKKNSKFHYYNFLRTTNSYLYPLANERSSSESVSYESFSPRISLGYIFSRDHHHHKPETDETSKYKTNGKSVHIAEDVIRSKINRLVKIMIAIVQKDLNKLKTKMIGRTEKAQDDVEVYVNVLNDMIKAEGSFISHYDWLQSTVDIEVALEKLLKLSYAQICKEYVHPADLLLLKYVMYLFKMANENEEMSSGRSLLPKTKFKKKPDTNAINVFNKMHFYMRDSKDFDIDVKDLLKFLAVARADLKKLHSTIKEVAEFSTYKKQNWFQDLKVMYLKNASRKELLTVLLHLSLSKVIKFVDNSSKHGLIDDLPDFLSKYSEEINSAGNEMAFVINVFKELNKFS